MRFFANTHASTNANNGLQAGPFTLNVNNDSGNRNRNNSSHVLLSFEKNCKESLMVSSKYEPVKSLVATSVAETLGHWVRL
ncbi:MAG: hypothetical protein WCY72_08875 [Lysobacteraceae bacterium]